MKKVAIFTRTLLPNGANKSLIELLKRIDYHIIDIDLYILDLNSIDQYLLSQIPNDVVIKPLPRYSKNIGSIVINFIRHPYHFIKAIVAGALLRNNTQVNQFKQTAARYPIIDIEYDFAISYRHYDIDVFFVANNIRAKKKAFWVHGVQPLNKLDIKLLKPIYKKYDHVFPVSITAKNNLNKYFTFLNNKFNIIYCIVDGNQIIEKSLIGNTFPTTIQTTILTIGRLSKEKGMDLAIKSCNILKERNIDFKWYICGDGPMRYELEELVDRYNLHNHFVLMGHIDNPYGYLKSCDIYVQPSRLESYCLAINEAKILRKPIVSTNFDAAKEQIIDLETGIICEQNPESLANKLEKLIKDNNLRKKLSTNLSKQDYSNLDAAEQLEKNILN